MESKSIPGKRGIQRLTQFTKISEDDEGAQTGIKKIVFASTEEKSIYSSFWRILIIIYI